MFLVLFLYCFFFFFLLTNNTNIKEITDILFLSDLLLRQTPRPSHTLEVNIIALKEKVFSDIIYKLTLRRSVLQPVFWVLSYLFVCIHFLFTALCLSFI